MQCKRHTNFKYTGEVAESGEYHASFGRAWLRCCSWPLLLMAACDSNMCGKRRGDCKNSGRALSRPAKQQGLQRSPTQTPLFNPPNPQIPVTTTAASQGRSPLLLRVGSVACMKKPPATGRWMAVPPAAGRSWMALPLATGQHWMRMPPATGRWMRMPLATGWRQTFAPFRQPAHVTHVSLASTSLRPNALVPCPWCLRPPGGVLLECIDVDDESTTRVLVGLG